MRYRDLHVDTPYLVTKGDNETFLDGDIFWVDSVCGSLNIAGSNAGWLEKEEVEESYFDIKYSVADGYYIKTSPSGRTRLKRNV